MSIHARFPYAFLQQIRDDLNSITKAVQLLQSTVESIGTVLSGQNTELNNVFSHPTFTDCTVGTLSYVDDEGCTSGF